MKLLTPTRILLACTLALIPSISLAQTGFGNGGDNRDPFNRAASGDTSGLLQLFNQAQLNGKNDPNYANNQQQQLNSATDDFRSRQLQMLRDRNKKNAPAPAVQPK
jgi:hypothetical protein